MTPLHDAAGSGSSDCVKQLITAEAQVDIQDKIGRTALHYAADIGQSDCVQQLITAGAQVDVQDNNGRTALTHAARGQHTEICRLLLSHSVAVDGESGDTALITAARRGDRKSCKTLIAAGVDVHHKNNQGYPINYVYHWQEAKARDTSRICKSLAAVGVDVDRQNKQGDTALIVAAQHKRTKMLCKMLISAKSNREHKNKNGKTAADLAEEAGNTEVAACIRQYEAKQAKRSQKKNKEPFDSDYSAPTPAFLPMSPGGWDEIMAQSPATWDVANEVLQEEDFTDTISVEDDEKTDSTFAVPAPPLPIHTTHQRTRSPLRSPRSASSLFDVVTVSGEEDEKTDGTFAVPAQPPPINTRNQGTRSPMPSPRGSSSLFDVDPPLPQTSQQADNHPLHSNPPADVQQETCKKSSDDKIQALLKQLKENENIIKEKEETIAQKGDKIKNQEETIANKGDKIKNQDETIARKGDKIKNQEETIAKKGDKIKNQEETIANKGDKIKNQDETIADKRVKLKNQEEKIEQTQQELSTKDRKLQLRGKRIYECEEMLEEQEQLLKDKDKHLALKKDRIMQIENYQEEEAKKRKYEKVEGTAARNLQHITKESLESLASESPVIHSIISAIHQKHSQGSTQGLYSRELDQKCTRADIETIHSAMDYICILVYQTTTGRSTATGFLLGIVRQQQSGQVYAAILTNKHILPHFISGVAYFNYFDNTVGMNNGVALTNNNVVWDDTLDYAMFCVDNANLVQRFSAKDRLIDKVTPLFNTDKAITLIGHPNGDPLQVDMFMEIQFHNNIKNDPKVKNAITALLQGRVIGANVHFFEHDFRAFYKCTSFRGSSGSPCFRIGNGHFDLVSLHSGGIFLNNTNPGANVESDYESGVVMHRIKDNINSKMAPAGMIWV